MADKYLGNKHHFNKPPTCWLGLEVYPGNGAASNLYGTLNVIKNPDEPTTPNINTDGNVNVKKNVNVKIDVNVDRNVNERMLRQKEKYIQIMENIDFHQRKTLIFLTQQRKVGD
jgi:hypothetical protein